MFDYELKLINSFHGSYINGTGEFIAEPKTNQYFILKTCKDELEVKCKVLEWFSRPAHCTQPKNKKLHKFMLDGINTFLGTNFTAEEIEIIYCEIGNGVNRALCEKFIKTGYDMSIFTDKEKRHLNCGTQIDANVTNNSVNSDNLVYPMFNPRQHIKKYNGTFDKYYVSCNYGTVNPFSLGLWGYSKDGWYRIDEYYYSARNEGWQLTDEEYYQALEKLINGRNIEAIIIPPSAASFIETVKKHEKYRVIIPDDSIQSGINEVRDALNYNKIFFYPNCVNTIKEFGCYSWDKSNKKNRPKKENDRTMDDMRYFVTTIKKGGKDE